MLLKREIVNNKKFVDDVFMTGNKSIFETISKNKIPTGMEKTKKKCKKVDVLKEDKKAFYIQMSIEKRGIFVSNDLPPTVYIKV